jgi:hypothetical protein
MQYDTTSRLRTARSLKASLVTIGNNSNHQDLMEFVKHYNLAEETQ